MEKSSKSIIEHINDFLDYCDVEKGLSENTQRDYKKYLQKFVFWLKDNNKESLKPHELAADDVWHYRLFLSRYKSDKGKGLKKITQNYYLIALRALLSYFSARDIESLPSDKITLPKDINKERTVKFLKLEQLKKLLEAPDTRKKQGLRDRAILETLFSTGLRVAELVSLNREQFQNIKDKKDLELSIIGKGDHPRTIYFSERALSWIKKYLGPRKDQEKPLFIRYAGRKNAGSRLTSRTVERMVKKYAVKAGAPAFTTPHVLRHTMATDLLEQGVDLRTIQEFLGHRSINSTQIYTHVTSKRLRDIHRRFHSGKNL